MCHNVVTWVWHVNTPNKYQSTPDYITATSMAMATAMAIATTRAMARPPNLPLAKLPDVGFMIIPPSKWTKTLQQWWKHQKNVVGLMPGACAGLLVGLLVVSMRGALVGLQVDLSVGTLGTGGCGCMEHVILLLSLIWFLGTLGGACTLGTHCVLRVSSGVVLSSNLLGCACKWACVASTICSRSCAAWEVLALPVIPWMTLMQSANACITLLMCVMEGSVIRLCWNWTLLDSCLLLVCLIWQSCVQ